MVVVIEAGWLNKKVNFHSFKGGKSIGEKIASAVGANHEVGRKIAEMCEYFSIPYVLARPSTNKWKAEECREKTGIQGRTNQEQRDALKVAFEYSHEKMYPNLVD